MKAILCPQYGSPDALQFSDVAKPVPHANQVLVEVHAASANPLDWHRMRGEPFLARLSEGMRKLQNPKLGADVAGRVEAVGSQVTQFKPGDAVFGSGVGAFAEYMAIRETGLTLKPSNLSFEAAAAVPVAALTALQGLRDTGQLQAGQKVLVNGASGGVGTFAVQLAKAFGAEVTGVCSTRNLDLVRSIGAEHAIDYTRDDFTRAAQRYDLIFDAVGNRSVSDYQRALSPQGICVVAGFTNLPRLFEHMLSGPLRAKMGQPKVGLMRTAQVLQRDLVVLKEMLEAGKIAPVIDRCYPLEQTADAIRYLEAGHARGKVVIMVKQD